MRHIERKKERWTAGFTLIELLVVLVIIGLLGAIVAPRFIGKGEQAKPKIARQQIEMLGTALDTYKLDVGTYPESLNLLIETGEDEMSKWDGPYLKKKVIPKDIILVSVRFYILINSFLRLLILQSLSIFVII